MKATLVNMALPPDQTLTFEEFKTLCQQYPAVMFPAFELQREMRDMVSESLFMIIYYIPHTESVYFDDLIMSIHFIMKSNNQ